MSYFLKGQGYQLLHNVLGALELGRFESQHGLFTVQVTQLGPVGVKLLVVEVAKLGGNGIKVNCG